jgi:transcription antitermination factor NusG
MTKKIFALLLLSLTLAACDSSSTETNSNANNAPKVNAVTPTTIPSPSPEPSPSVTAQLKPGDKVKVASNGTLSEGTVVSVDEKSGKLTVRLQGESKDKLVSISDVTRQ